MIHLTSVRSSIPRSVESSLAYFSTRTALLYSIGLQSVNRLVLTYLNVLVDLCVEVHEQEERDDPQDGESGPVVVVNGVIGVLPQRRDVKVGLVRVVGRVCVVLGLCFHKFGNVEENWKTLMKDLYQIISKNKNCYKCLYTFKICLQIKLFRFTSLKSLHLIVTSAIL